MLEIKGVSAKTKQRAVPALLNVVEPLPYHFRAGRYQCFGTPRPGCTKTKARPDGGRVNSTVAQWRTIHAYLRSHSLLPFDRRLRPTVFAARPRNFGWQPRLPALQYRAHR